MYRFKETPSGWRYEQIRADIQKSIRIDRSTLEIIEGCEGRSFSDKLRRMAEDYDALRKRITEDDPGQNVIQNS